MPSNQTSAEVRAEIQARLELLRRQRLMVAKPEHLNAEVALEDIDWLTEALDTVLGHVDKIEDEHEDALAAAQSESEYQLDQVEAERDSLAADIKRLTDLHAPVPAHDGLTDGRYMPAEGMMCQFCSDPWDAHTPHPCRTVALLNGDPDCIEDTALWMNNWPPRQPTLDGGEVTSDV